MAQPEKRAPKEWLPQLLFGLVVGLPLAVLVAPHCQRNLRLVGFSAYSIGPGLVIIAAITAVVVIWVYRHWGR